MRTDTVTARHMWMVNQCSHFRQACSWILHNLNQRLILNQDSPKPGEIRNISSHTDLYLAPCTKYRDNYPYLYKSHPTGASQVIWLWHAAGGEATETHFFFSLVHYPPRAEESGHLAAQRTCILWSYPHCTLMWGRITLRRILTFDFASYIKSSSQLGDTLLYIAFYSLQFLIGEIILNQHHSLTKQPRGIKIGGYGYFWHEGWQWNRCTC